MTEGNLVLDGEHSAIYIYIWYIIKLYTGNLYNFVSQCHPDQFNKKLIPTKTQQYFL